MSELVLILGMHRSGTSCLAGCLAASGLWLGPVPRRGVHNRRGNQELQLVAALNRQLIREGGGDWHRPPEHTARLGWPLRRRIFEITQLLTEASPRDCARCGIKDPLLLPVLENWLEVIPAPAAVASFRHPLQVTSSLQARQSLSPDDALDLWLLYNDALIRHHQRAPFPLVEYDLEQPGRYLDCVAAAARRIGLEPDPSAMAGFVSADLHHQRQCEPVPARCAAAWEYLRAHRTRPA